MNGPTQRFDHATPLDPVSGDARLIRAQLVEAQGEALWDQQHADGHIVFELDQMLRALRIIIGVQSANQHRVLGQQQRQDRDRRTDEEWHFG